MWLVAGLACSDDPPAEAPPEGVCADPGARAERPFDRVVLDGEPADTHRFWGAGLVAADLDGDGDADLFVPGPSSARLWRNDGRGGFTEDPAALPDRDWTRTVGGVAADLDADSDLDLVATRFGYETVLLWNDGAGRFAEAADPVVGVPHHSQAPTVVDLDGDGALDVLLAGHGPIDDTGEQVVIPGPADPSRLLLGDGAGGFADATDRLPQRLHDAYTYVLGATDLDGDARPDLFAQDDYPVWETGMAVWNAPDGFAVADPDLGLELHVAGMGLGAADVNADGSDDFLVPVWDRVLMLRSFEGRWYDTSAALGVAMRPHAGTWIGWGAEWVDLDLDGDLDGVFASGHLDVGPALGAGGGPTDNEADQTYTVLEDVGGSYVERTTEWGLDDPGTWRGFAVADLNGDGWPDLARRDLDGPVVLDLSRCGDAAWLVVRPQPPARAVGARVTVTAGERSWTRTVRAGGTSLASGGPPEVTFGLGAAEEVDRVEVLWPDGGRTVRDHVPARAAVLVR